MGFGVKDAINKVKGSYSKSGSTSAPESGLTEEEQDRYLGNVRSNRFSASSAMAEYDAAVKRNKIYKGTGSSASALKDAENRLQRMGITQDDIQGWEGANARDKAGIISKLESKRDKIRSDETASTDNMRFTNKGQWEVTEPRAAKEAKAPSEFRGFVSESHQQQMGTAPASAKVNFMAPSGSEEAGGSEAYSFFNAFQGLKAGNGEVIDEGNGAYLLTGSALKQLQESGAVDKKMFSGDEYTGKGSFGARVKVAKSGKGYSAEFSPVKSDVVLQQSEERMADSLYGQYAKRMAGELARHNDAVLGTIDFNNGSSSGYAVANTKEATSRLNKKLEASGFSATSDGKLSWAGTKGGAKPVGVNQFEADSFSLDLESSRKLAPERIAASAKTLEEEKLEKKLSEFTKRS